MKNSVLITGVNGRIGSYLARRLMDQGYRVLGASLEPSCPLDIPYRRFDISRQDAGPDLFSDWDVDTVIHLAAIVHRRSEGLSFEAYERTNYHGCRQLADSAARNGVSRFIFSSTIEVYGRTCGGLVEESSPRNPVTDYARTKKMAEDDLLDTDRGSMRRIILRLAPVYARDFTLNLDRRVFLSKDKLAYCLGRGRYGFHCCSIHNIGDFIIACLAAEHPGGVFNIADHAPITARELIALHKKHNPRIRVLRIPYGPVYAAVRTAQAALRLVKKGEPMLSAYNLQKLILSTRWSTQAMESVMGTPRWTVENTLFSR